MPLPLLPLLQLVSPGLVGIVEQKWNDPYRLHANDLDYGFLHQYYAVCVLWVVTAGASATAT